MVKMKYCQIFSHKMGLQVLCIFIPHRRNKTIFGVLGKHLGVIFYEQSRHKESKIEKGHLHLWSCPHVISSIAKYIVSNMVGFLKGMSAITIPKNVIVRDWNFTKESLLDLRIFYLSAGLYEGAVKHLTCYIKTSAS